MVMPGTPAKSYPYGRPVHPPQELLRWQARLRRRTLLLILSTALALGLMVEARLLLASRPAASVPEPAVVVPSPTREADPKQAVPEARPVQPPDRIMEIVADLAGTQLYQCHLTIGLLADAMENAAYPENQTRRYLEDSLRLLERVDRQLAAVGDTGLTGEGRDKLTRSRRGINAVRVEAARLRAYWETGDPAKATAFHRARQAATTAIKDLLGTGDKTPE
jgi:hypothetical protein